MGGSDYLLEPLTQRELDILRLLAEGLSNREIAGQLFLAQGTIKWYNKQLYSKLAVHSREKAVEKARELGLLEGSKTALLSGTVTFLFTDIEGSTKLWEQHPQAMGAALSQHDTLLRQAIQGNNGRVFKTVGDAFCAVFDDAARALFAAHVAQSAILAHDWGQTPIRVRIALHTGTAELRDEDYFGPAVNHVARLLAAGHGGQVLLSAATSALAQDRLPQGLLLRDLGRHRLKDLQRAERIYQLIAPGLPADFPSLDTAATYPNNLPTQLTSFVGRESEIAELKQLLGTIRLLTLTGPPGTGKTRLALQVAAALLNQFPDGVFFVDLAPISNPALVANTIAQLFGVREMSGQPVQKTLQNYLCKKRLLLLIDNFEQVIAAALLVGELLTAAPDVKILVTSREALHIYGEQEYAVSPLMIPDPGRTISLSLLSQFEAVDLFCQRAKAVKSDFVLTEENASIVSEICQRLDGLPLAIELAAARSKLFSPANIRDRLESRLLTLTGGSRDLPARMQTLRAAIDWSYELLDTAEQTLFARLAVFQGSRSVEATEAVCGHGLAIGALAGLESLLNKSLLSREIGLDGEPRFVMLEMLHEYARGRLQESGEAGHIQQRHAEYFLSLAERAAPEMRRAGYVYWSRRLRDEHNNFRAALAWALGKGDAELALQLAGVLRDYWYYGGYSAEGLAWIKQALEKAKKTPLAAHAQALNAAGWLSYELDEHVQGRIYNIEALALFRELEDDVNTAWALTFLGSQFRALPGGSKEGLRLCEEGLALFRRLDDRPGIIWTLNALGELSRMDGDYERAGRAYGESLAMAREEGDKLRQAIPLGNLGYVAYQAGDYERAEAIHQEGLALLLELENTRYIPQDLAILAGPVAAQGNPEKAARLLGASEALLEKMGLVAQAADQVEIERYEAAVREQLDQANFEAAWSQGRAMSLEEAVAYALGDEK